MAELATAKKFRFVGGDLALDFCNTMGGKRGVVARDRLVSCVEFLAWSQQAGLLEKKLAEALADRAEREPKEAASTLTRAVDLREALFRIVAALIEGRPLPRGDVALLNSELARSLCRLRLAPVKSGKGFTWEWASDPEALDQSLGQIAHAAATLLADEHRLSHLSMCRNDTCGWLFVDQSKNHSRRWCDMRDCGNRAKIRRHRLKKRTTGS